MSENKDQGDLAGSSWKPDQYLKFSDLRLRPALELLARIPIEEPREIWDLGCGSGEATRMMAGRWSSALVHGLDQSPEMLHKAKSESGDILWVEGSVESWQPEKPVDLIYSNATLHWVAHHDKLFPRLARFVRPGGCLAVQMPLSWDLPSHRLMRETLASGGPGGRSLGGEELRKGVARRWVDRAEVYYDLLSDRAAAIDIWETEYVQILTGDDPVLEWVKGTGLRPILNGLDHDERELFLNEYARQLRETYRAKPDGRTLFPFRRLFIVAKF